MIKPPPATLNVSPGTTMALRALAVVGLGTAALGLFLSPDRMWANWLLVSIYLLGLALAGLCFVAIHYTAGASWGVAVRRVPEGLAGIMPWGAAGLILVLLIHPQLYSWTRDGLDEAIGGTFAFKRMWLSRPFFVARAVVCLGIWLAFAMAIRGRSQKQDQDASRHWTQENVRLSAVFLVLFGLSFTVASFDWVMSLEPMWYSTIFGVYNFAGLFSSGLGAIILAAIWLERAGPLQGFLTDEHLHDLGKLLFAFCTFWMYIWFSQYMLIWYTNMPEETVYYQRRLHGGWAVLFVVNIVLNWLVPFLTLIRRDIKRRRALLGSVAGIVLVGRWVDLYLMIMPSILGEHPGYSLFDIGLALGGVGVAGLALITVFRSASAVPLGDPYLFDSLHYEH